MRGFELVVFDVAGTTVRDDGQVPAAFTAALGEHGLPADPHVIRSLRGAAKRQAVHDLLPSDPVRADAVYVSFRRHLSRAYTAVAAVPGAAEEFAWLRDRGVKVALNTGFDRDTLAPLLAALGWKDGRFDGVVCGDEVNHGRPAPDLIRRCMRLTCVDVVPATHAVELAQVYGQNETVPRTPPVRGCPTPARPRGGMLEFFRPQGV